MGKNLQKSKISELKLSPLERVLHSDSKGSEKKIPLSMESLTTKELYVEIEKSFDDFENGRYHNFDDVVAELEKEML